MKLETTHGYRLSAQQAQLWHLGDKGIAPPLYSRTVLKLKKEVDVSLLKKSFEEAANGHEILSVSLQKVPGLVLPVQVPEVGKVAWNEVGEGVFSIDECVDSIRSFDRCFESLDIAEQGRHGIQAVIIGKDCETCHILLRVSALCCDMHSLLTLIHESLSVYEGGGDLEEEDIIQYAAIIDWQQELLADEGIGIGKNFWMERLRVLDVGRRDILEKESRQEEASRFEKYDVALNEKITERIQEFVKSGGTEYVDVMLAATALLWKQWGNENKIFGVVNSEREEEGLESILGTFARTLPQRVDVDLSEDFLTLVKRISEERETGTEWSDCFNWELWEAIGNEKDTSVYGVPVQVSWVEIENSTKNRDVAEVVMLNCQHDIFKIKFEFQSSCSEVVLQIQYDLNYYEEEDVAHLGRYLLDLLEALLKHPEKTLGSFPVILNPEIYDRVLLLGAGKAEPFEDSCLLHDLIELNAVKRSDAVAVVDKERILTHCELDARANQLAHYLRSKRIGPDDIVGVCLPRSVDLMVTILGVLKAGGAYLPLDPSYPVHKLEYMMEDSGASVLIATGELSSAEKENPSYEVIDLFSCKPCIEEQPRQKPDVVLDGENLAYVIYTSGSTGQAKGVMISHRAIVNHMQWMRAQFPLQQGDSVLQKTPISFDASVWEFYLPLITGGRLVFAEPQAHMDLPQLLEVIDREEVTLVQFVPTILQMLLEHSGPADGLSLKHIFCGGELLETCLVEKCQQTFSAQVHNLYGPSEVTVDSTWYPCLKGDQKARIPIGSPISNLTGYVLNPGGQLLPHGVVGDLYFAGKGVGRGYLNRPALTADKFRPDSFNEKPGERYYQTGDHAWMDANGQLYYQGRVDSQIKLNGVRIELGEIENVLQSYPMVKDALVVPHAVEGGKALVAYYEESSLYQIGSEPCFRMLNRNEAEFLYREIFKEKAYHRHGIRYENLKCVLDVGANIGLFSLYVHSCSPDCRIYSFEPSPTVCGILRDNMALYRVNGKAYNLGVSSCEKKATFTFYPQISGSSGFYADPDSDREATRAYFVNTYEESEDFADQILEDRFAMEAIECELKPLSWIIAENQIEEIDLLKIDVEKSELDVLNGLSEKDWVKVKQIVIEVHDEGGRLKLIVSLLEKHGFNVVTEEVGFLKNSGLYNLYASKAQLNEGEGVEATLKESMNGLKRKELKEHLEELLPSTMIPRWFMPVEKFPLLPNGKVDRYNLPHPEHGSVGKQVEYVAPTNDIEEMLEEVFKQVLDREKVGIEEDFFQAGGDSIRSIQAVSVAKKYGLDFEIQTLFQYSTIKELALRVRPVEANVDHDESAAGPVELSPVQQWFFNEIGYESHWNQSIIIKSDWINFEDLTNAVAELQKHHAVLRSAFNKGADGKIEVHVKEEPVEGVVVRYEGIDVPEENVEARLTRINRELQKQLDLSAGLVMRVGHVNVGEARTYMILVVHHLVIDAISWRILGNDLVELLESGRETWSPVVKTPSYYYWSQQVRTKLAEQKFGGEKVYWERWHQELPSHASDFQTDFEKSDLKEKSFKRERVVLSKDRTAQLFQAMDTSQIHVLEILLGVIYAGLYRWKGQKHFLVDIEGHGRERSIETVDISRTVGWFTTIHPIFVESKDPQEFIGLLRGVKKAIDRAKPYAFHYLPLKYIGGVTFDIDVPICVNYLGNFDRITKEGDSFEVLKVDGCQERSSESKRIYLIEFNIYQKGGQLILEIDYSEDIFRAETIAALGGHCENLLVNLANKTIDLSAFDKEQEEYKNEFDVSDEDWSELMTALGEEES